MYILLYVGMCSHPWIKVHLHSNDQFNHLRKETKFKKMSGMDSKNLKWVFIVSQR